MNNPANFPTSYHLVNVIRRLDILSDWLTAGSLRRMMRNRADGVIWPSVPGAYIVGDRTASVAVCTLTSNKLMAPVAALPGVAIVGRVYTANFGIEKLIANLTANPHIRFLVVCGKESPFFQVSQALQSLRLNGITPECHIIGAQGHLPQLSHIQSAHIECFRKQVEVVDYTGETDVSKLASKVRELTLRNPGQFMKAFPHLNRPGDGGAERGIKILRPGGHREPLAYDPKGFFIISLDRQRGEITVHHYLQDNTAAHILSGRNAEAILLGLLREGLISQMSHAGYLGAELAKSETALRLGLPYEQDQPLHIN